MVRPALTTPAEPIQFHETAIPGCYVVAPATFEDDRGRFARVFCADEFSRHGLDSTFAQCSLSSSRAKGTLRGLHYQAAPHGEAKLVRCSRGQVFDVAVDVRQDSPTFARWTAIELSADRQLALYIPDGVAHGFVTLEPDCEVSYQISISYRPEAAKGIRWDDPDIAIDWPDVGPLTMSERDLNLPVLASLARGT